jgi:20S proteasome alpha/beta subunit
LAVENLLLSKLLVPRSNRRTFGIGDHATIAVAGRSVCGCGCVGLWGCEKSTSRSPMLHSLSHIQTHTLTKHTHIHTHTGLVSDGRQIVNRAREEAENYKDNYGSPIPPAGMCVCVCVCVYMSVCEYVC